MTKRIEEELAEMNRLKRLELEFLFFKARMDATMLEKFRKALINKDTIPHDIGLGDVDSKSQDPKIRNVPMFKIPIKKVTV